MFVIGKAFQLGLLLVGHYDNTYKDFAYNDFAYNDFAYNDLA
jgi:hypothetical protein